MFTESLPLWDVHRTNRPAHPKPRISSRGLAGGLSRRTQNFPIISVMVYGGREPRERAAGVRVKLIAADFCPASLRSRPGLRMPRLSHSSSTSATPLPPVAEGRVRAALTRCLPAAAADVLEHGRAFTCQMLNELDRSSLALPSILANRRLRLIVTGTRPPPRGRELGLRYSLA